MRRNSDELLRALERKADEGDPGAAEALARHLARLGVQPVARKTLLDLLGGEEAALATPVSAVSAGVRSVLRAAGLRAKVESTTFPDSWVREQRRQRAELLAQGRTEDDVFRGGWRIVPGGFVLKGARREVEEACELLGRPTRYLLTPERTKELGLPDGYLRSFVNEVYTMRGPEAPSLPQPLWPYFQAGVERGLLGKRRNGAQMTRRFNSDEDLRKLERALGADPKDAEIARRYAMALLRRGSSPSDVLVAAHLVTEHTAEMLDALPTGAWVAWLTPGAEWRDEPDHVDPDFADSYPDLSDGTWEMNHDVPGWIVSHKDPVSGESAPPCLYRVTTTFYGVPGEEPDVVAADPVAYDAWDGLPKLREDRAQLQGWLEYWAMVVATGRDPLRQVTRSGRQRIRVTARTAHDETAAELAVLNQQIDALEPPEEVEDEESEEETEPTDGDLVTQDHRRFYEVGRTHRGPVVVVPEDEDWRPRVRAYFDRQQFWPSVWFESDHGNLHPMSLDERPRSNPRRSNPMDEEAVRLLINDLEAARSSSLKNMAQGMHFIRKRPEWYELTSPEYHDALVRVARRRGGVGSMNDWAREFYEAAIVESSRRLEG